MEQLAKVLHNNGDKALVKIERQSACQECHRECLLAVNEHEVKDMEVEVDNPVGAKKGQIVKLEMGEAHLVMASLIVYILPILGMITGYFLGSWIGSRFLLLSANTSGIIGSFILFFLVFLMVRMIDLRLKDNKGYHPQITKVII